MPAEEKIFNKVFTYSFSEEQVKKILIDLLILSGEKIPVDVHDALDPEAYCQYDSPVKIVSESTAEIAESFLLRLSFTDEDMEDFIKSYNEELETRHTKSGNDTGEVLEPLPENVWTQETKLPCGKD